MASKLRQLSHNNTPTERDVTALVKHAGFVRANRQDNSDSLIAV